MQMTISFRLAMGVLACVVIHLLVPTPAQTDYDFPLQVDPLQDKPVSTLAQAGDCGLLCDSRFWLSATPADVRAALADGADLTARSPGGFTPLHVASFSSQTPAVVTALLNAGADPTARDKRGWTPLHYAARWNKNPAIVTALLNAGAGPHARDKNGVTPLHWAARWNKNPAVVTALLDAGADLMARAKEGVTPLHWAARWNKNPAVVTALLDAGADPHARTLHSTNHTPDTSKPFIRFVSTKEDETPLHWAARWNKTPAVVTALLDAGADPHARTKEDETPLHYAAGESQTPAIVTVLLNAGADPKARTDKGKTAFDLMRKNEKLKGTDVYWRLNDLRYE